jgi:excisionase family DNA binding protein
MFEFLSVTERKFSVKQTADILGIDVSTVSRLLARGKLAHFPIGGRRVIAESHLEEYLKGIEKPAKKRKGVE